MEPTDDAGESAETAWLERIEWESEKTEGVIGLSRLLLLVRTLLVLLLLVLMLLLLFESFAEKEAAVGVDEEDMIAIMKV